MNSDVFKYLFQSVSDEQACWKPGEERWSILEVINHLYDEEREDFRKRLELVLNSPEEQWPPIDPEGWVVKRKYNERNLSQSLHNFFEEREKSLLWLKKLDWPDWQATHHHAQMGPMSAELILANWLAQRSVPYPAGNRPAFCLSNQRGEASIIGLFRMEKSLLWLKTIGIGR